MVEQTHAMCLQQANETMMLMMTNETHKTVLMQMNYTNTTAEELEIIPLCSHPSANFAHPALRLHGLVEQVERQDTEHTRSYRPIRIELAHHRRAHVPRLVQRRWHRHNRTRDMQLLRVPL